MKVLVLIISSNTQSVYNQHKDMWRLYMKLNPSFECYFIEYHSGSMELKDDTFYLPGKESYEGVITKTLDSFDYFMKKDTYDFIIRTNLSSFWNFHNLENVLKTFPTKGVYSGIRGVHENKIPFVSGSGFIMTPDVVELIIENRELIEAVNIIDDVDIGYVLVKLGVSIKEGERTDIPTLKEIYVDPTAYHYRIKSVNEPREYEIIKMKYLFDRIYA